MSHAPAAPRDRRVFVVAGAAAGINIARAGGAGDRMSAQGRKDRPARGTSSRWLTRLARDARAALAAFQPATPAIPAIRRRRAPLRIGLLALALLAPTLAHAELRQFGGVIYPVPPGWSPSSPGNDPAQATLSSDLPDDRCDYCRILVGPGAPASGSLTAWLDRNRLAFVDEDDRADFSVIQPVQPTTVGAREAAMIAIGDGSETQLLVAIRAGDRFALTGFEGDVSGETETADSLATMTDTYLPWLPLLRFRSDGAPSLLPAPRPGELTGLWWGTRMDTRMGMDMMLQTYLSHRRLVFWPDGTFFEGTPPQGMAAPDRTALDAAGLTEWGNYAQDGARVRLTFADGSAEMLDRDGDSLSDGRHDMFPVQPLADGTRLSGGISSMTYTGFSPGSGVTGGISSSSATEFAPDGSYAGSSFGGAFGSFGDTAMTSPGGFSTSHENSQGGRYEIRDGLLIMTPEQGEPSAEMIFRAGDSIVIGGEFFKGTAR